MRLRKAKDQIHELPKNALLGELFWDTNQNRGVMMPVIWCNCMSLLVYDNLHSINFLHLFCVPQRLDDIELNVRPCLISTPLSGWNFKMLMNCWGGVDQMILQEWLDSDLGMCLNAYVNLIVDVFHLKSD